MENKKRWTVPSKRKGPFTPPDDPVLKLLPGFLRFYGQSGVMGTGSGPLKPLKVKHALLTVGFAL